MAFRQVAASIREPSGAELQSLWGIPHPAREVARKAQIAELPDLVRGYESIKLRNVARFRERAAALEAEARQRARVLRCKRASG